MENHGTYGWIVFSVALVPFFFVAGRIETRDREARRTTRGSAPAEAAADAREDAGDESAADPHQRVAAATNSTATSDLRPATATLVAATGAALVGPLLYLILGALPASAAPDARAPGIAPAEGWVRAEGRVRAEVTNADEDPPTPSADLPWTPAYRGADEHRTETWSRDGQRVQVDRMIYRDQSQGAELINSLNRIAPDSLTLGERVVGPLDARARAVRESVVRTPHGPRLVWYWYRVARNNTPSPTRAKVLELVAFLTRSPASELVAVSAPCEAGDCRNAAGALLSVVVGRELPPAPDTGAGEEGR